MTKWQRGAGVLWRTVFDDVVLLPPTEAEPFALAGGAHLWELLEEATPDRELPVPSELLDSLESRQAVARCPG